MKWRRPSAEGCGLGRGSAAGYARRALNLPNKLTVLRLILTALLVVVLSTPLPEKWTVGLLIFIVASLTDYWDGMLARKLNLITNFGKLMDPLADKVLMAAVFVLLCADGWIPAWVVVAVLAREFIVTGMRLVAGSQGQVLAAEALGKHKTIWQIVAASYYLTMLATSEWLLGWLAPVFEWRPLSPDIMGTLLIVIMAALTLASGVRYFWNNRHLFADA